MRKGRAITVKFERPSIADDNPEASEDVKSLEERAELYLTFFERIALKVALGVGGYVLLDTFRRVQVARAQNRIG